MDMLSEPMTPVTNNWTYGGNKAFHNFVNDYSHIADPNLRRRLALSEIDKVPFGLYHVRAVAVAGVGFFLDSYDIFSINLITAFLGIVFWHGPPSEAANGFGGNYGALPGSVNTALKASTSAGIVIGQVVFGWLADVFGRRRMYGIELGIIVFSTLNCALASPSPSMSSTGLLVFWRAMMGIGIGGDYPLSSVITSEFAPTRWRGAMMAAVFSMQGMGQLLCAIVALVVTVAFKESFITASDVGDCSGACQVAADRSWRIIVGFGALPACFALYYRITIPETPRYTFDVAHDIEKADADIKAYMASQPEGEVDPVQQARTMKIAGPSLAIPSASWVDVFSYFREARNMKILLGTTLSWFFLDLAFYGLGLNNTIVLEAIGYSHGPTLYDVLYNNAVGMIILACAGSLPGYWMAVFTIDTMGRKPLQFIGFVVLTVLFCILGFYYSHLSRSALLTLYVIAQFFFNWGPNTTTFIVPGECFPTRYRSTGHGLSAASGKIGAILGQVISIPLLAKCGDADGSHERLCSPWLDRLMQIFALFMLLGTFTSLLIPETRGVTLEELAGEAPTSYNQGRNGSIYHHHPPNVSSGGGSRWWWSQYNPFGGGGQPAGFFYPRMPGGGTGTGTDKAAAWPGIISIKKSKSPRMGIMTSPELAAQQREKKEAEAAAAAAAAGSTNMNGGKGGKKKKGGGGGGGGVLWKRERERDLRTASSDSYDSTVPITAPAGVAQLLPGWGAGWGRIDRLDNDAGSGQQTTSMDNIRLHDVGRLLK
ncbi:major facilitator superfamily domain-containing protein [Diplogelasinospora grovesii]|uniref:Major facilitator superfamily domain-containing protein n=1 Tax=Diplogelasinospora grovesii TaxID=303347 RepID=A0AAN6N650_9PEZI|nr:major facilitator superfamily domain-containing protein [Diplogelasinospora grovesii]